MSTLLQTFSDPLLAALPWREIPPLEVGPLKFYPFGFLVACAIVTGTWVAARRAKRCGLDPLVIHELSLWAVIVGFVVSHLYSWIFYFPDKVLTDPLYPFKIWDGISSFGGFIGGTLGGWYYCRRNKIPLWPYADVVVYGFVFAWIFGRLGCTVAFDHPGAVTDFFLAMEYPKALAVPGDVEPPGLIRHNLGFYEALWSMAMGAWFWLRRDKAYFVGWYVSVTLLIYTPIRFAADFLRAEDKTWIGGLTGGQYAAIALFLLCARMYFRGREANHVITPDGELHVYPDGTPAVPGTGARSRAAASTAKGRR